MTRDERFLLAAVSRHLREQHPLLTWPVQVGDLARADFDEDGISVYRRDRADQTWPTWPTFYPARTVTEGVDLAVALGLLPHRFSSSWRAVRAGRGVTSVGREGAVEVPECICTDSNLPARKDCPHCYPGGEG